MTFLARTFIDADNPVASIRLLVQERRGPLVAWQWELPYGLWASWGTEGTAMWLYDQFCSHDANTAVAVDSSLLRQALLRGLYRHQADEHNQWFSSPAG